MADYPDVYPSKIKFRPGRIQSLSPDQELVLKQCWATMLKYMGYKLELTPEDLRCGQSFVASSIVWKHGSPNEAPVKKKTSRFSRKPQKEVVAQPSRQRARHLHGNTYNKYESDLRVSEHTEAVYWALMGEDKTVNSSDIADTDSDTASFVTAYTQFNQTTDSSLDQTDTSSAVTSTTTVADGRPGKATLPFMKKYDVRELQKSLLLASKNDLVDNLILRYVRARKLQYEPAMEMLVKAVHWRTSEYDVEQLVREGDAPAVVSGTPEGFVRNFKANKAFIRGQDVNGNPLFIFQSRKHFASDATLKDTERYALLIIEWCRLFLREVNESVDTCSLMFDLTGFSLKNADNAPVKFLISMFEANYPESLGIVIVHNAPWIFSTVWNVIKGWLDPVVSSKIHFTKGTSELKQFVKPKHIPEYLGGEDTEPLEYIKPRKEHTVPMREKDDRYRDLVAERHQLQMLLVENTIRWVECTDPDVSSQYLRDRIRLNCQLSDNYIALDPYLRNPGVYDRNQALVVKN